MQNEIKDVWFTDEYLNDTLISIFFKYGDDKNLITKNSFNVVNIDKTENFIQEIDLTIMSHNSYEIILNNANDIFFIKYKKKKDIEYVNKVVDYLLRNKKNYSRELTLKLNKLQLSLI